MNLYLDDDSASVLLARLLRRAGHDVELPTDVGKAGERDAAHFAHAIQEGRLLLSKNHHDFEALHDLVLTAGGHHSGLLVVRNDNNPRRDLNQAGIVRALGKLTAAGVPTVDQFVVLNHWR
jgi:hypothetical protein